MKNHYLHGLNATPNYSYLGHPINAYHLIRHVGSGWDKIIKDKLDIERWIRKNFGRMLWSNSFDHIGKILYIIHQSQYFMFRSVKLFVTVRIIAFLVLIFS